MIPRRTGSATTDWVWPVITTGFVVLPEPGDQVWVDYEDDDLGFPVWVGKAKVTEQHSTGDVSQLLQRIASLESRVAALESAG